MVVFDRGDLVRISGASGIYVLQDDPVGIVIDLYTDNYNGSTVLKVRLMDGNIKNVILSGEMTYNVELISRGKTTCIRGKNAL